MQGFLILDFGSQVTQLIARRLRDLGYYSEIQVWNFPLEKIKKKKPFGIILSGGPSSVKDPGAPLLTSKDLLEMQEVCPLLGICYGMQLMAHLLGGEVQSSDHREYGSTEIRWEDSFKQKILKHLSLSDWNPDLNRVWMSHGDVVTKLPKGFVLGASSVLSSQGSSSFQGTLISAMHSERSWAFQFHPEVAHTPQGSQLIWSFARHCGASAEWKAKSILEQMREKVLDQVRSQDHVLCALSGGVDSTVVATFLTQILGRERVHCVFVNNGLLRKDEFLGVQKSYDKLGLNLRAVDAEALFLRELAGVSDPEKKRKIIGRVFIEVFEKEVQQIDAKGSLHWLAQGTLYPDVIESVSPTGAAVTIKSHHNVGGLPERMKLKLLEPLRDLFKDEVRKIGAELGLNSSLLWRHPFPGPGLAIRVIGEVTKAKLELLRQADEVYIESLKEFGLYEKIWQAFAVLLPVSTVGVMGDARTYDQVIALRAVTSSDGMTADWFEFPGSVLREISNRITNRVKGINRVVYDITSKPPGTIEWE